MSRYNRSAFSNR